MGIGGNVKKGEEMNITLSEKELYCMARLLQSMIFFKEIFHCCKYCKYEPECVQTFPKMEFDLLRKNLDKETGVYLGFAQPTEEMLEKEK